MSAGKFILVSGSSGSGKSFYAENLLNADSRKIYIATAKIYDDEMRERVARHKLMRADKNFITIEKSHNLTEIAETCRDSSVLIESLTTWTANEIFCGDVIKDSASVINKIFRGFMSIKAICNKIILVSDNIFCDGITYNDLTERYIKTLAELLKIFAREADDVIEIFSGLSLHYKN